MPTDPYARAVTDQMRSSTLRALGIDLPLPVELPVPTRGARPIPKTISALWVGDKAISAELVENLAKNAKQLKNSQYQYRLFLSRSNPSVYEQNLRQLQAKAPRLTVLPLEEQAFFRAFEQSKYFDQYQAALDGNGGVATNYASASDVLRYPMLHHEGGLYIDVDDELLAPGSNRSGCIGWLTPCGAQGVDEVELAASEDGLLLHPAMSNEKLSMDQQYNTSMIGSHPGNPTLIAISEEMHGRYQAEPDFYQSRPDKDDDPAGFYAYASRLNRLTGPGMLTAVVDRLLPDLYRLRQLRNLYAIPRTKSWLYVDLQAWSAIERELLPLGRFAKVGGQHSWAHT
ncbi:TcdA/TcdB catalytic glycosyltransferase domain protein [compost metagenome]